MIAEPAVPPEVLAALRAPFADRGATPVDPPVLLPLSLLLDLAGEALRARLFVVQAEGAAEAALRPDFTVAVLRQHLDSGRPLGRYAYEGRAFRAAPPGSDRPQEFLQIGLEVLGETASPEADAEIVALAWAAASAGGRGDLSLKLGDVALFEAFAAGLGLAPVLTARLRRVMSSPDALRAALERAVRPSAARPSPLADLLAHRPEAEAAAVLEEIWALAGVQPVAGRSAAEIAHRLAARAAEADAPALSPAAADLVRRFLAVDDRPGAALSALAAVAREAGVEMDGALETASVRLAAAERAGLRGEQRFSAAFGRAFEYYDGFLFEVRSAALGPEAPVAAGGRYDRLPPRLGGAAAGAVGCMVRPWRAWRGGAA